MSLNLPCNHGNHATKNDSRCHFDATPLGGFLTQPYSIFGIGCGNPKLHQDHSERADGGNNVELNLFGHYDHGSLTGTSILQFRAWGCATDAERMFLRFRPNNSVQQVCSVVSEPVTRDNFVYCIIERLLNDYAVHLFDRDGNITTGSFVTHDFGADSESDGITFRPAYLSDICFGGEGKNAPPWVQTNQGWKNQLENVFLIQSDTPIANKYDKVKNVILGADATAEFGVTETKLYRTLKDTSLSSLSAHPNATQDTHPAFTFVDHNIEQGSPLGAVNPTIYCSLNEEKINFHNLQGAQQSRDVTVTVRHFGAIGNIEGRILIRSSLAEQQTWQTLAVAPGGTETEVTFSAVPRGVYCFELRPSAAPANVYEGRNDHVVGFPGMYSGQSQIEISAKHISSGMSLEAIPVTAKGYIVDVSFHSSRGARPSVMKCIDEADFTDLYRCSQIAWEQVHPGVPLVHVRGFVQGTGIQEWLNNGDAISGYPFMGDGVTPGSGLMTDIKLVMGSDTTNVVMNWGTNDKTDGEADYSDAMKAFYFDEGSTYSSATHNTLHELFPNKSFALSQLTRATNSGVVDNYSADPVGDDYLWSTQHRERQLQIISELKIARSEKIIIGNAVNDFHITNGGGPHPPLDSEANDRDHYIRGIPRLGYRMGADLANLHRVSAIIQPSHGAPTYTDGTKTAFKITVDSGSFGVLKNGAGSNVLSGYEVRDNSSAAWNRKGFTVAFSGQDITFTKNSGAWTAAEVRFHVRGPYDYGTSFTAEMRADMLLAPYVASALEGGLGVPVPPLSNGETGGVVVGDFVAETSTTATRYGISVTVAEDVPLTLFADGSTCFTDPGDLTITAITPTWDGVKNGVMINPIPNAGQGFETRLQNSLPYTSGLNVATSFPITWPAGSSLMVATGVATADLDSDGAQNIETIAVFTHLATTPPAGSFRPAYCGNDKSFMPNVSGLNLSLLLNQSKVTGATPPDLAVTTAAFDRPWIEVLTDWKGRSIHPELNQPSYGRTMCNLIVDALNILNLDYTEGEKTPLLINLVQYAIDIYGAAINGAIWEADGGHNAGRKPVLLQAAIVLGAVGVPDSTLLAQAQDLTKWQDDLQVFLIDQLSVDTIPTIVPGVNGKDREPFTTAMISTPWWGIKHNQSRLTDKSNFRISFGGHYTDVAGSTASEIAAWALRVGAKSYWANDTYFDYYLDYYIPLEIEAAGAGENSIDLYNKSLIEAYGPAYAPPILSAGTNDSNTTIGATTDSSGGLIHAYSLPAGSATPNAATIISGVGAAFYESLEPTYHYAYTYDSSALGAGNFDHYFVHENHAGISNVLSVLHAAPNTDPTATPQSLSVVVDTPKAITLSGSDVEAPIAGYVVVDDVTHGALSGTGAERIYTPSPGYEGADSFTFKVIDSDGAESTLATVSLSVAALGGGGGIVQPVAVSAILRDSILQII